jgi:hypothetical protein
VFTAQPNALYQVNPANGSLTFIGNSSEPYAAIGSTTSGVYKLGYDANLYSINVATGASTLIGPTGIPLNGTYTGNGYIGMSANGSNLYINQNSNLYVINTSTGHVALLTSTSPGIFTQMLSVDDILYGASDTGLFGGGREVFTFDSSTDTLTAGPYTNSPQIWGLTPATPLPSALPLFVTGIGGLGLLSWRRKRKARASA